MPTAEISSSPARQISKAFNANDRRRLHNRTSHRLPSGEGPKTQQHFEQANHPGGNSRVRGTENFRHNQTVPGNTVENLTVEPMKNPNRSNYDLSRELKRIRPEKRIHQHLWFARSTILAFFGKNAFGNRPGCQACRPLIDELSLPQ